MMVELIHQVWGQPNALSVTRHMRVRHNLHEQGPPDDHFLNPLRGVIDDLHNVVLLAARVTRPSSAAGNITATVSTVLSSVRAGG